MKCLFNTRFFVDRTKNIDTFLKMFHLLAKKGVTRVRKFGIQFWRNYWCATFCWYSWSDSYFQTWRIYLFVVRRSTIKTYFIFIIKHKFDVEYVNSRCTISPQLLLIAQMSWEQFYNPNNKVILIFFFAPLSFTIWQILQRIVLTKRNKYGNSGSILYGSLYS